MTNNPTIDGVSRAPTAAMTEAGCQAYMDADGMIGVMHNSSMGHAYIAMRALDPEVAALQSTIAQLQAENEKLLSGFFQEVSDEDLKKISDFVGDGDLPKRSFFMRQDAGDLTNMTMHMVREVQSLRIRIAEQAELLKRVHQADALSHNCPLWVDIDACLHATAALNGERK